VLEDASVVGASPTGWARRVKETAERWAARKVVVETNQGGDMVRAILRMEGVTCRVEPVYAVESKRARAEPVAALYEKEKVTHCGVFAKLEEEMLALGCEEARKSRDRVDRADALVWALTDLLVNRKPRPGVINLWE
jgi:phage terminase large subunit-like protein